MGFDCHIAIGGDGSLEIARRFAEKGMPVVGVPKTIDSETGDSSLFRDCFGLGFFHLFPGKPTSAQGFI